MRWEGRWGGCRLLVVDVGVVVGVEECRLLVAAVEVVAVAVGVAVVAVREEGGRERREGGEA